MSSEDVLTIVVRSTRKPPWQLTLPHTATTQELKLRVCESDSEKMILLKRSGSPCHITQSHQSLRDVGVGNEDIIIVMESRTPPWMPEQKTEPVADAAAINAAIAAECKRRREQGIPIPNDTTIPVSLHDSLNRIGHFQLPSFIQHTRMRPRVEPSPILVQRLVDMGFPESRSRLALVAFRNVLEAATEWLVEHPDGDLTHTVVPQLPSRIQADSAPASSAAPSQGGTGSRMDGDGLEEEREAGHQAFIHGVNDVRVRRALAEVNVNPGAIFRFLEDPEIGPLLQNILRAAGAGHES